MSSLLRPAVDIIEQEQEDERVSNVPQLAAEDGSRNKKVKRRKNNTGSAPDTQADQALDFRHDTEKLGYPKQDWKTASKIIWLMHVLMHIKIGDQFSARVLVATFNKHFKQAGTVTVSNTTRDLGYQKTKSSPSPVGEDSTQNPPQWYLTSEGKKKAQQLVDEAIGKSE